VISVRAEVRTDIVRLEVADQGTRGAVVRRRPDLRRGGGFGLNLVEKLSQRWHVDRDDGTRVWAELALRLAGPDPATSGDGTQPETDERAGARERPAAVAPGRAQRAYRRAVAAWLAAARMQKGARHARERRAGLPAESSAAPRASR
jgi:hypothetical protein